MDSVSTMDSECYSWQYHLKVGAIVLLAVMALTSLAVFFFKTPSSEWLGIFVIFILALACGPLVEHAVRAPTALSARLAILGSYLAALVVVIPLGSMWLEWVESHAISSIEGSTAVSVVLLVLATLLSGAVRTHLFMDSK